MIQITAPSDRAKRRKKLPKTRYNFKTKFQLVEVISLRLVQRKNNITTFITTLDDEAEDDT